MYTSQMSRMRLRYGKHAGKTLDDVPRSYLRWLLSNSDGLSYSERKAIIDKLDAPPVGTLEAARRENVALRLELAAALARIAGLDRGPPVAADALRGPIGLLYKRLSTRFHPDAGGDHKQQVALNAFRDGLAQLLEKG